ncbi:hypothetical protein [uncultured Dubosiella sp.]|uniref:hypothetical protein n=1 Tax=uncultured Dubosiella sp. TaxID=1937011 RepID=UPI0025B5A1C1|nr:hypothetical protein [uncultured Dubosiella sp.]
MSKLLYFCIYFLAYFPLWIIIILEDIVEIINRNGSVWTEWISIMALIIISLFCLWRVISYFSGNKNKRGNKILVLDAKEDKNISIEFFLSYILPLYIFDFQNWLGVVEFVIFFLILCWVMVQKKVFCPSIIFNFLGYKIYNCEIRIKDFKTSVKIICKEDLENSEEEEFLVYKITNQFYQII